MSQDPPNHNGHVLADRYEIIDEIGRGGFGMVYRARQINMNREVAVKVLPPQFMAITDVVERFKREAQLASRLQHPNTITIHDYGQADDLLFIVMELLNGEDWPTSSSASITCPSSACCTSRVRRSRAWPRPTSTASCTGTSSPRTSS